MRREPTPTTSIDNLTRLLNEIKISHERTGRLISELENQVKYLKIDKAKVSEVALTLDEYRGQIGSRVRVLNPSKQDEVIGTVFRVGKIYVTVLFPQGTKRNRIPKNIRLINHE